MIKNIEQKTENEKIDWKELIPLYGVYRTGKKIGNSEPSLADKYFVLTTAYHAFTAVGIIELVQYLSR